MACTASPPGTAGAPDAGAPSLKMDGGSAPQQDTRPAMAEPAADPPRMNMPEEPPRHTRPADPACGLAITDIALYQGVKVPLVREGVEVKRRETDLIQQRPALLRVFVKATGAWKAGKVTAELTIKTGRGQKSLKDQRPISGDSTDADLATTLNFDVPADVVTDDASYTIAVTAPSACEALRFPADGKATLGARRVGTLKIKLVPIKFAADGSDRLPDTSEEQLDRFRSHLMAMFPVASVELSVRSAVKTSVRVTGEPDGWNELLDSMRDLRAQDRPDADVFYFGLISPGKSLEAYCPGACYFGLSFRTDQPSAVHQAGVGLGFTGEHSAGVLAHEMGHLTGRKHAPCKVNTYLDPQYPQAEGKTASWGWDDRSHTLLAPEATRDMMGYCSPAWISAYTFGAILDRLTKVNGAAGATKKNSLEPDDGQAAWRVLLAGGGQARWGVATPVVGAPAGVVESARVLDASGAAVTTVQVWRSDLGEEGGWSVLVPEAQPGWHSIEVAGAPAVRFDAPAVTGFDL